MYKPSQPYHREFTTSDPTTGAARDADSLPVATANRNGTDDGTFALTVARLDAGRYQIAGTVPSGYAAGDVVNVTVAATVAAVAGKAAVDAFLVDTKRVSDLNDLAAAAVWAASGRTLSSFAFPVTVGTNGDKAGYGLAPAGLDPVTAEAGVNARQALALILDGVLSVLSGADGTSITIKDPTGATTRAVVTVPGDGSGDRTAVALTPPA